MLQSRIQAMRFVPNLSFSFVSHMAPWLLIARLLGECTYGCVEPCKCCNQGTSLTPDAFLMHFNTVPGIFAWFAAFRLLLDSYTTARNTTGSIAPSSRSSLCSCRRRRQQTSLTTPYYAPRAAAVMSFAHGLRSANYLCEASRLLLST